MTRIKSAIFVKNDIFRTAPHLKGLQKARPSAYKFLDWSHFSVIRFSETWVTITVLS
jgi:hypothetical protein